MHTFSELLGESDDEANEDFGHTVDWTLIPPPFVNKISATKYQCAISSKTYNSMPQVPERFDVFDFDKVKLIETISRYEPGRTLASARSKYKEMINKVKDLHATNLQQMALENLRVWKHKKEQELLGQVNIQNADYSERSQRMGVGMLRCHYPSHKVFF